MLRNNKTLGYRIVRDRLQMFGQVLIEFDRIIRLKLTELTLFDRIKFGQNRPAGRIFNKIDRIRSSMRPNYGPNFCLCDRILCLCDRIRPNLTEFVILLDQIFALFGPNLIEFDISINRGESLNHFVYQNRCINTTSD